MAQGRRPGRPAHGSREKLIGAACALFAERGFTATSPTMILKRSGIGHGSLYHYFEGKEDLALAAIEQMRAKPLTQLGFAHLDAPGEDGDAGEMPAADIHAALDRYFTRKEGRALLHLLTDPAVSDSPTLSRALQEWCYDLRAAIYVTVAGEDAETSNALDRLHDVGDPHLTVALGRGLLALPRQVALSRSADPS